MLAEHQLLAYFHAKQGDDHKTLGIFRDVLEQIPDNATAWFQKAKIEARMLNFEQAIADLDRASALELAIDGGKLKGQLQIRRGLKLEALETWNDLLKAYPDDEELHEDLIELQLDEGLYD